MTQSRYEAMRMDAANWKLGIIYFCPTDPRVIVRQRRLLGWTWNFGNLWVIPALMMTFVWVLGPIYLAWWLGMRSMLGLLILVSGIVLSLIAVAIRLSRDPAA